MNVVIAEILRSRLDRTTFKILSVLVSPYKQTRNEKTNQHALQDRGQGTMTQKDGRRQCKKSDDSTSADDVFKTVSEAVLW